MGLTKVNHPDLLDLASDTGATVFPKGTTAERPVSPEAGYIRFNTTDNVMETYDGTEWKVLDTIITGPYSVDYLVIAGGGSGGGYLGGGGGAGGFRSTVTATGGGGSLESALTLTPSTTYTITVGAGGASVSGLNRRGNQGSNSVFSTITSIGGGSGGGANSNKAGGEGGSGGGAASSSSGGAGTSNQGFRGGNALSPYATVVTGGGGAGSQGLDPVVDQVNTDGGNGVACSITGSLITRAGGGGGGSATGLNASFQIGGNGGSGGGGDGGDAPSGAGTAGTVNTGSGGGGPGGNGYTGNTGPSGAGGSGVVILRLPTARYSGATTGSPTVTTDGSDTILTYTSSGTYTA